MPFLRQPLKLSNLSLVVSALVLGIWTEEQLRHFEMLPRQLHVC